MRIAIASGKGGTGKTTIAVNLAMVIPGSVLIDCDVEGPNAHLFYGSSMEKVKDVTIPVPEIDVGRCTGCGKCSEFCRYNALMVARGKVLLFKELCHGCGGCVIVCPHGAISEKERRIGIVQRDPGKTLFNGILDIGEPFGVPIIRELKRMADPEGVTIFDSPPGTGCPAVEAMRDTDLCILVTAPTPFGLHDLKLSVEVVRDIGIPFCVVVNRDGIGDDRVEEYCRVEGIRLLGKIPNDMRIARAYSDGIPLLDALPEYRTSFETMYEALKEMV